MLIIYWMTTESSLRSTISFNNKVFLELILVSVNINEFGLFIHTAKWSLTIFNVFESMNKMGFKVKKIPIRSENQLCRKNNNQINQAF